MAHAVSHIAYRYGGNSGCFDLTLNQTHGLMAFRSDRHQEQHIHAGRPDPVDELRDSLGNQRFDVVNIAETVMCLGQLADDAFLFQLD